MSYKKYTKKITYTSKPLSRLLFEQEDEDLFADDTEEDTEESDTEDPGAEEEDTDEAASEEFR